MTIVVSPECLVCVACYGHVGVNPDTGEWNPWKLTGTNALVHEVCPTADDLSRIAVPQWEDGDGAV